MDAPEEWRDVAGYEGLYQISDRGQLRRLPSTVTHLYRGFPKQAKVPARTIKLNGQYPQAALSKNGVKKKIYAHHLVAEAFLGPRPPGLDVCHNDGERYNCHVDNLRYDTPLGNLRDQIAHGTRNTLYDEEAVAYIKHDLLTYQRAVQVARVWGIPYGTVDAIKTGRSWTHVQPVKQEPLSVEIIGPDD